MSVRLTTNDESKEDSIGPLPTKKFVQNLELFYYDEVVRGPCLGHGSFANVYEVNHFKTLSENDRKFCKAQLDARCCYSEETKTNNEETDIDTHATKKYAIKCLRDEFDDPDPKMVTRAAKDLETECNLLATINHPNIVKIYAKSASGTSAAECKSNEKAHDFFLVEDRLIGTLADKIEDWKLVKRRIFVEPLFFRGERLSKTKKRALLEERLHVSDGVASALAYLHKKRIIYRDLKPENVGFDFEGTCKLFDFGLARRLPDGADKKLVNDTFKMSGQTGNLLLMAPEVWLEKPYNEKADVYCFAILLWMILSLELPYRELLTADMTGFTKKVMLKGQRPHIQHKWPKSVQLLLRKGWSKDMNKRPTMQEACNMLKEKTSSSGSPMQTKGPSSMPASGDLEESIRSNKTNVSLSKIGDSLRSNDGGLSSSFRSTTGPLSPSRIGVFSEKIDFSSSCFVSTDPSVHRGQVVATDASGVARLQRGDTAEQQAPLKIIVPIEHATEERVELVMQRQPMSPHVAR